MAARRQRRPARPGRSGARRDAVRSSPARRPARARSRVDEDHHAPAPRSRNPLAMSRADEVRRANRGAATPRRAAAGRARRTARGSRSAAGRTPPARPASAALRAGSRTAPGRSDHGAGSRRRGRAARDPGWRGPAPRGAGAGASCRRRSWRADTGRPRVVRPAARPCKEDRMSRRTLHARGPRSSSRLLVGRPAHRGRLGVPEVAGSGAVTSRSRTSVRAGDHQRQGRRRHRVHEHRLRAAQRDARRGGCATDPPDGESMGSCSRGGRYPFHCTVHTQMTGTITVGG